MNMTSLRDMDHDDRFKNIPKQILSITVNNPYLPVC